MRVLPITNVYVDRGSLNVTRKNEGMLPLQAVPIGGRLCQFVEGWKRITNDPYVLSIVGYILRFTPLLQTPWEIRFPKGHRRFRECKSKYPFRRSQSQKYLQTLGFYLNVFCYTRRLEGGIQL